ncbi:phosphatidylserine/phosphatidylglycerophosphate/cardiolipin synthase-like enzyme [Bradyrhizobium japonicum]
MQRLDPPGYLDDLNEAHKEQWSQKVSGWLNTACRGNPANNDGPRSQFFNPLTNPPSEDAQVAVISWNAFPRQVKANSISDTQRWRRADADRNVQDEYCEWSVTRDPATRKIIRVDFTCEGPEYWEALAAFDKNKVLELYRSFVSPSVTMADIFDGETYNPYNRFNNSTDNGAMHLIQGANSLTAEIELGAAATIRRVRDGGEITDAQELIRCSRYGEPGRNSDPFIGAQVNALARQRSDITINNPIGLYFHDFNPVGWTTPDGEDARKFWKYVRGKDDHFVRATFEVPSGRGYTVGDILIAGRKIAFGAQIVDFITIKLEGLATRIGASTVQPLSGCRGAVHGVAAELEAPALTPLSQRGSEQLPSPPSATPPSAAGGLSPAEQAIVAQLPAALRSDLEAEATAEDGTAPPALLPYPKLPASQFNARMVPGEIIAYASPDSTYAVTKKLISSARSSIVIGIYDFNADYMKEALKQAMRRGVSLSLMLDTNHDDDPHLFNQLKRLGANCVKAPSSSAGNPVAYFGNAHEKIIVIDGEIVMIQSGNWSENSIPFNEGDGVVAGDFAPGNRDMGIAVHSRELASFFAELVARDMRLSLGEEPDSSPSAMEVMSADLEFFEAAPPNIPRLFSSRTFTPSEPVRITPVVTPENFHETVKKFVRSAKRSIRIEQQYIRGGQPAVEAVLEGISTARTENPDLVVQIIVSPKYLYGTNKQKFLDAMNRFDFAFDDNFRYLSARHFVHCHNKLIVVDEEKVLLGSQNWSTTGLASNRETSLLVEHAGIAGYFAQIFDSDWQLSEPTGAPDELAPASPVRAAHEFAQGGVVVSRVSDYKDV